MTLIASLATLMDLGRAYWVHKYDSNWIAKICLDTYRTSDDYRTQRKLFCTVRKGLDTILWQVGNLSKVRGWVAYLFLQLGLGQQLWNKVQTDMDRRDSCHS